MGQELNKLKKHKIISIVLIVIGVLILLSGIGLTAVLASPINSVTVKEMVNGQEVETTKQVSTFFFLINNLPDYQLNIVGYLQIAGAGAGLVIGIILLALGSSLFAKNKRKTNEMLAALQDVEEDVEEEQVEEDVEATTTEQVGVKTRDLIGTQSVTTDVANTQAVGTEQVQGEVLPNVKQPMGIPPSPAQMNAQGLQDLQQRPQQGVPRPMGNPGANQPRPMQNGPQNLQGQRPMPNNQQGPRPMNAQGPQGLQQRPQQGVPRPMSNPGANQPRPIQNGPQNLQGQRRVPNNQQGPKPINAQGPQTAQQRPQQGVPRPMSNPGANQPQQMPKGPQNLQGPRPMGPQSSSRPQQGVPRSNGPQGTQPRPMSNNQQGQRPMSPRPNGVPNKR